MCCEEGDLPVLSTLAWRKARKAHRCWECGEPIRPGERYQHVTGMWDGDWLRFKTCADCVDTRIQVHDLADFWPAFGQAACCFVEALREASR